ncbi:MAG: ABC transporter substrate-binding protein [Actinomycetia bacterium]|nr:ABC transporter substrate-binding protein [Actinomycetes bacterium]
MRQFRPRFRSRTAVLLALVSALAIALAACGGDDETTAPAPPAPAPPAEQPAPAPPAPAPPAEPEGCQVKGVDDGEINLFGTTDAAGAAGDIGPSGVRWAELYVEKINAEGGILGCTLVVDIEDEPFPEFESGIRKYRAAIDSGEYDAMIVLFDSALMLALPEFTSPAKVPVIVAGPGDHQPFYEEFSPYLFQAGITTLHEARASAQFAIDKGWRTAAIITPNYAYGQDVASAFVEYFERLGGTIVEEQFPDALETNFQSYVNAVVSAEPDVIFGGQFGGSILALWQLFEEQGLEIPTMYLVERTILESITSENQAPPPNSYGYTRGALPLLLETSRGQEVLRLYQEAFGDSDHPLPSEWVYEVDNGLQMLVALVEETRSVDPDVWEARIDEGDFGYVTAYNVGLTAVDPLNNMSALCADVGLAIFDPEIGQGNYDPNDSGHYCLPDVLSAEEAAERIAGGS